MKQQSSLLDSEPILDSLQCQKSTRLLQQKQIRSRYFSSPGSIRNQWFPVHIQWLGHYRVKYNWHWCYWIFPALYPLFATHSILLILLPFDLLFLITIPISLSTGFKPLSFFDKAAGGIQGRQIFAVYLVSFQLISRKDVPRYR